MGERSQGGSRKNEAVTGWIQFWLHREGLSQVSKCIWEARNG